MRAIGFLFLSALISFNALGKKVHFMVNMIGQTKSPNGIHVMGDFQDVAGFGLNWTPNTCLMTQDVSDTNLYHLTVDLPAFAKYEYRYVNGDQSYETEIIPLESQVGYNFVDNRWIFIDSLNTDTMHMPAILFGGNSPAGLNMIRFLVDMTTSPSASAGVHVAGNFQSNDPTTHRLYSFGNNVFEIIAYMNLGSQTYKFYNGNTMSSAEVVPTACAVSGDRSLTLNIDTVLPVVCFSFCATCYPVALNDIDKEISWSFSPNPAQDQCLIRFADGEAFHHVAIVDMQGRYIKKVFQIKDAVYPLSLQGQSKGTYQLVVQSASGKRSTRTLIVD